MGKLTGKVAWVTGAGSGIGEAAALALAEEGATIVLTGRRPAPLEDVATRIRAQGNTTGNTSLLAMIVSMDPIRFEFAFDEASYLRYERLAKHGGDVTGRERL